MPGSDRSSAIPDHVLPLPATPNFEFERKRAKQILVRAHECDIDSLTRIRKYRSDLQAKDVKLSDVHLTLAREYGFASWPVLVEFFTTLDRHERAGPHNQSYGRNFYESQAAQVIRAHAAKRPYVTRGLAAFIPRLYGRTDADSGALSVSEDEA